MSKADILPTPIRSRRAVLAGLASAAAVPIVAAIPTTAQAMPAASSLSDERLIKAANGLLSTDEAIEQMHRQHAASGATGDADEQEGYAELEDLRREHIETLIVVPATSMGGALAKAGVLKSQRMIEDDERHQQIAVSLADDLFDLDQSTIALGAGPIAGQSPLSEALALVDLCRQGDRRWGVLYDQIERAEHSARPEHGARPSNLIEWRNYSAIYGAEIEGARDRFIGEGIDEKVIQAEYRSAKKRFRATFRAQEDWDRKVGLNDLRKEYEAKVSETQAAWKALGKVRLTSIRDAAAIIGILRERMHRYDELTDGWEIAAFMNASRFITRTAA